MASQGPTRAARVTPTSDPVPIKEADQGLLARYSASLEKANGIIWQQAYVEPLSLRGYPYPLKTIASLPPGYVERTYPSLDTLALARATPAENSLLLDQLRASFVSAIAQQNLPMAFRYAIVRILQLRSIAIDRARAELRPACCAADAPLVSQASSGAQPFFVLRECDAFPPLPIELHAVLHSVSYGASPMETVCRQALGIEHLPGSLAGVRVAMPLYTVNSVRHSKIKGRHIHYVQVPSLIFKVPYCPPSPRLLSLSLCAASDAVATGRVCRHVGGGQPAPHAAPSPFPL
jgi:hypothetical protein